MLSRITPNPDANPPIQEVATIQTTSAKLQINNAKLFVPPLSINNNIKLIVLFYLCHFVY